MIEVKGKYNEARIFTDTVDNGSVAQVLELCNQEFSAGSRIRLMPDIHVGSGCTVGTAMTVGDRIVPAMVGVDIGCGMETVRIREKNMDPEKLDRLIREKIPAGFRIHSRPHPLSRQIDLNELFCIRHVDADRAEKSIGTLGGGNHFIEADRDEEGNLYIVVHSGSRRLGLEAANYYQKEGYRVLNGSDDASLAAAAEKLKEEGRHREIAREIRRLRNTKRTSVPRHLAYVSGDLFRRYIHDMKIIQRFAALNRRAIAEEILSGLDLHPEEQFTTVHNYIDTENMILRKGSVSAQKGEKLLIPVNMRDGSLICTGKGNEDWNYSAPHGAGRLMSRTEAKRAFTVSEYEKEMESVYTTSVNRSTLDECPMAYKNMRDILDNIGPTARVDKIIRPVYNFKAGGEG